ncbi:hypothetical protein [Algibacter mikhailovii]|uniref:hypothetical protein n=1 Tax=Algibacter mikhailovii TaxID=425498 RepID=UPI002494E8FC|nr:hypothetical protein [Algibacter mikhailovii]
MFGFVKICFKVLKEFEGIARMLKNTPLRNSKLKVVFSNYLVFFSIITTSVLFAQSSNLNSIAESFQAYTSGYREVAYCHLNKSTYIKGEMLGFTSYVIDKNLKTPSKRTRNLYCVIRDSADKVVKSKLIKIEKGFANNVFNLDSLFTTGIYTFQAYTNWMNNFDERNVFLESFKVIDPATETFVKRVELENKLDAQFLPEGGHFVDKVKTNVGVVIKDNRGYGLPNIQGNVYDSNNKYITTFKTNALGFSRFLLFPEVNQKYVVKINYLNNVLEYNINNIEPQGISIHLNNSRGKLALEFKTNRSTLKEIQNKPFKLIVHNGNIIKEIPIAFKKEEINVVLDYKYLFTGINIFTLLNSENKPVLERVFFNHKGLKTVELGNPVYTKKEDSIQISIPFITPFSINQDSTNISVAVLPETTVSYKRHQNIISYNYLQPYVNGYVENASYYFTNIDSKKSYELDNLLITQGWSSYDWKKIFNRTPKYNFVFEEGIVIKGNKNTNEQITFVVYPDENSTGHVFEVPENEKTFEKGGFYPSDGETIGVSTLNKRGKTNKADLYIQFSPIKIPDFNYSFETVSPKILTYNKSDIINSFGDIKNEEVEVLDEVLIKSNLRQTKIDKLKAGAYNRVYEFDDTMRATPITLLNYINQYVLGFRAEISALAELKIYSTRLVNRSLYGGRPPSPIVYLNDNPLYNLDALTNFDMRTIDYMVVRTQRALDSQRQIGDTKIEGSIKIYTSNEFLNKQKAKKRVSKFVYPLTFSKSKKFYTPEYNAYNDDFFREYGVIDWIPDCKLDRQGNLSFTVYNPTHNNIKLFIEGVTENGDYLSEVKKVITKATNTPE